MDGAIRHVVYQDSAGRNLKYATCVATDCLQPTDWTISAVSLADGGQDPAIALGPNHLLAVTYYRLDRQHHEVRLLLHAPASPSPTGPPSTSRPPPPGSSDG